MRRFADVARLSTSPLWALVIETAERTVAAWKTLEQSELLPEEMRATIEKHILRVTKSIAS
jgi:hypothetical protein